LFRKSFSWYASPPALFLPQIGRQGLAAGFPFYKVCKISKKVVEGLRILGLRISDWVNSLIRR
jgi:hypothetical protein